ncbi:MAG: HAD hydrolase family protein [Terrisporobacter sp.]
MIRVDIPGREKLKIENILFDFNGTLAVDGKIVDHIKDKLITLSKMVNIIVITADTYGSGKSECDKLDLNIMTFPKDCAGMHKQEIVYKLGSERTVAVGNGYNDLEMFEASCFSVAVIGEEGLSSKLLLKSDIITRSIEEAIDLFLKPDRIKADLRW